ncbi:hypothetical protein FQZ97_960670 [compost metagenome]
MQELAELPVVRYQIVDTEVAVVLQQEFQRVVRGQQVVDHLDHAGRLLHPDFAGAIALRDHDLAGL